MKAILTKYLGPTNTLPSRVVASDGDRNTVTIPFRLIPFDDEELIHHYVADALCQKMNWQGNLVGGRTRRGYAFVFLPQSKSDLATKD